MSSDFWVKSPVKSNSSGVVFIVKITRSDIVEYNEVGNTFNRVKQWISHTGLTQQLDVRFFPCYEYCVTTGCHLSIHVNGHLFSEYISLPTYVEHVL